MQRKMFFVFLSVFLAVFTCPMIASASYFSDAIQAYTSAKQGGFCWFCPVFVAIFKGIDVIATKVSIQLAGTFLALLAAGLLFWIVFYVGRLFVQMQPIDMSKFFTDMLGTTGRAVVAMALLYSFFGIFTYLINPLLVMSMGLSSSIMEAGGFSSSVSSASQTYASQVKGIKKMSLCKVQRDKNKNIIGYSGASNCAEQWTEGDHAFTMETCSAMECSIRSMSASLVGGMAVGSSITSSSFSLNLFNLNLGGIVIGIIILLGHFLIYLAFPFKMIDALIRLGFVCALAPLFIVLWVFPATRSYTQKAWQMLLGSCMTFVFLAVVMVLILSILSYALPQGEDQNLFLKALVDGKESALDYINFTGSQFFVTIAVCFIGWKLLGMAETFSSAFGGVNPQVGAGAAAVGFAAGSGKLGLKAGKVGAVAGYRGSKWLGSKAWSAAKSGTKMGIVAGPMIGAGAAAYAGAAMRSAGRFLGFDKKSGADKAMSDAFKNNASMGKASYQDDMGITHTAKRNNKGVVDRVTASRDGVTMVQEKGKILGQLKTGKDENGLGFRNIVNDKGEIVESAKERKDGGWVTKRFKTDDAGHLIKDKDGNAIVQSKSTIEQVGDKIVRRTDDGKTLTTETSSSLAGADGKIDEGNVQAILSDNGEMFRPEFEQVEKINEDGSRGKTLSESKFEYDSKGNMTSSVEQDHTTGQTHFRTMDSDGTVDVVKNSDGVVLSRSAQDLMGNDRGLYFGEQISNPHDNIDKSTDWAKTDKEILASDVSKMQKLEQETLKNNSSNVIDYLDAIKGVKAPPLPTNQPVRKKKRNR